MDDAAAAVYAIQNAQTADLVRKVVVDSGQDPRDFVVYAYGGAGPTKPSAGRGARRRGPARFTDRAMVLRQSFCPSCLTLLATEIVPGDEPSYRTWSVRS